MADGLVQVAPDSTGKKVDTSELTRSDTTVVERQRVVLADDSDPNRRVPVTPEGMSVEGMSRMIALLESHNALLMSISLQLGSMASSGFIDPDDIMKG